MENSSSPALKKGLLMDFQSPQSSPSKESNGSLGSLNIDSDRNSPLFKRREEGTEVSANASKLQLRALIYKNLSLQAKQKGTNICQILTPIVCLIFIMFLKKLADSKTSAKFTFELKAPYMYNSPYKTLYANPDMPAFNDTWYIDMWTCLQWYLYDFEGMNSEGVSFVSKKICPYKLLELILILDDTQSGMLQYYFPPGPISKSYYYCNDNNTSKYKGYAPYFKTPNKTFTINKQLYKATKDLNDADFPHLYNKLLDFLPDGAITFYEATRKNLTVKLQINDSPTELYHRGNGVTKFGIQNKNVKEDYESVTRSYEGQLILLDIVTRTYLQKLYDTPYEGVLLTAGSQVMPQSVSAAVIMAKLINFIGGNIYTIALSLLFPVFLQAIVMEKDERLREMMKMNGLLMKNYWIANFISSIILYIITVSVFIFFGRSILVVDFFSKTSLSVLFFALSGWGLCQVSLSFFFQNFFAKGKTAMIGGYLIAMWAGLVGVTFSAFVYPQPMQTPLYMRFYPPLAFSRILYNLGNQCSNLKCAQDFSDISEETWSCMIFLFIGAILYLVLGLYLDAVIPQEFGVAKHPLFFLDSFKSATTKTTEKNKKYHSFEDEHYEKSITPSQIISSQYGVELNTEADDVKRERDYAEHLNPNYSNHPLIVKNLRKVYKAIGGKPPKVAVHDFSLHIKKGEMFGLLGPNGAGKTSLISMLTGLYPPEKGNAWVGGYSILDQIHSVHTVLGVCPQFDLLWSDLTVEEHLYFYVRIKGTPVNQEKAQVQKALEQVYLTRFASFPVKQLSGGMKRRLSVAIALVGNPQLVFLDEPTTGLDPENRRQLWDILAVAKRDKAIVLTTHSMEEADVLCTKIGIITDGALRCIGPQTMLKNRYGGGYHLFINCFRDKNLQKLNESETPQSNEALWNQVKRFITNLFPNAELKSEFNGTFTYQIPTDSLEVSRVFLELETKKQELGICDWGISQTTLEDVFMEIVEATTLLDDEKN